MATIASRKIKIPLPIQQWRMLQHAVSYWNSRHDTRWFSKETTFHSDSSTAASTSTSEANVIRNKRRLDVAIVGAPNAGKSQLLNILTQSPVAAVSRKRHTTRDEILGVRTVEDTQLVFHDTPGYLTSSSSSSSSKSSSYEKLDQHLRANDVSDLDDVDFTLLVVDAARNTMTESDQASLQQLMRFALQSKGRIEEEYFDHDDNDVDNDDDENNSKDVSTITTTKSQNSNVVHDEKPRAKFAIVLNKVDLVKPKSKLLDVAMEIGSLADICLLEDMANATTNDTTASISSSEQSNLDTLLEITPICFYISALKEMGTDDLLDHLLELATPCRVWAVQDEDTTTTMSPEEQVQELIREKIYRCLHREVPHSIHQVNRLFRKLPQGIVIHQDLVVFKRSHQKLVQGSAGRILQRIQDSATRDLKELFGCDVLLKLNVKLNKSKQKRNPSDVATTAADKVYTQM